MGGRVYEAGSESEVLSCGAAGVAGGKKEKREGRRETGEEEMVASSEGGTRAGSDAKT